MKVEFRSVPHTYTETAMCHKIWFRRHFLADTISATANPVGYSTLKAIARTFSWNPDLIEKSAKGFGSQCTVVALDAKSTGDNQWEIFTHGGRTRTEKDVIEWAIEVTERGAGELLVTSMDSDGHKEGYDIPLLRAIRDKVRVPIIASGGAGGPEHFLQALTAGEADAVLAASIFHFGEHSIKSVKEYLSAHGIAIRPVIRADQEL